MKDLFFTCNKLNLYISEKIGYIQQWPFRFFTNACRNHGLKNFLGLRVEARRWKIASEAVPLLCSLRLMPQLCEACASVMPLKHKYRAPQILQLFGGITNLLFWSCKLFSM